jgi:F-type H+-transporting ATPase subunit b
MNLNLTLLGQMLTFALFVWFTMKYVWPPITKALSDRQKKIADGLAAADQGQRSLELADRKVAELMREAKLKSAHIVEEANKRAQHMVNQAKESAKEEGQKIIQHAHAQIELDVMKARQELQSHVGRLAVDVAEKLLKRTIDIEKHQQFIDEAIKEVA